MEERLSDLKAESLFQRGTPVLDAAACSPVDTALHRALRNDKESLEWELEVFIALPHYPFHGSSHYIQAVIAKRFMGFTTHLWREEAMLLCRKRQCFTHCFIHTFKARQQAASTEAPATAAEHTAKGAWRRVVASWRPA